MHLLYAALKGKTVGEMIDYEVVVKMAQYITRHHSHTVVKANLVLYCGIAKYYSLGGGVKP